MERRGALELSRFRRFGYSMGAPVRAVGYGAELTAGRLMGAAAKGGMLAAAGYGIWHTGKEVKSRYLDGQTSRTAQTAATLPLMFTPLFSEITPLAVSTGIGDWYNDRLLGQGYDPQIARQMGDTAADISLVGLHRPIALTGNALVTGANYISGKPLQGIGNWVMYRGGRNLARSSKTLQWIGKREAALGFGIRKTGQATSGFVNSFKMHSKYLGPLADFVGAGAEGWDSVDRWQRGDKVGAAAAGVAATASTVAGLAGLAGIKGTLAAGGAATVGSGPAAPIVLTATAIAVLAMVFKMWWDSKEQEFIDEHKSELKRIDFDGLYLLDPEARAFRDELEKKNITAADRARELIDNYIEWRKKKHIYSTGFRENQWFGDSNFMKSCTSKINGIRNSLKIEKEEALEAIDQMVKDKKITKNQAKGFKVKTTQQFDGVYLSNIYGLYTRWRMEVYNHLDNGLIEETLKKDNGKDLDISDLYTSHADDIDKEFIRNSLRYYNQHKQKPDPNDTEFLNARFDVFWLRNRKDISKPESNRHKELERRNALLRYQSKIGHFETITQWVNGKPVNTRKFVLDNLTFDTSSGHKSEKDSFNSATAKKYHQIIKNCADLSNSLSFTLKNNDCLPVLTALQNQQISGDDIIDLFKLWNQHRDYYPPLNWDVSSWTNFVDEFSENPTLQKFRSVFGDDFRSESSYNRIFGTLKALNYVQQLDSLDKEFYRSIFNDSSRFDGSDTRDNLLDRYEATKLTILGVNNDSANALIPFGLMEQNQKLRDEGWIKIPTFTRTKSTSDIIFPEDPKDIIFSANYSPPQFVNIDAYQKTSLDATSGRIKIKQRPNGIPVPKNAQQPLSDAVLNSLNADALANEIARDAISTKETPLNTQAGQFNATSDQFFNGDALTHDMQAAGGLKPTTFTGDQIQIPEYVRAAPEGLSQLSVDNIMMQNQDYYFSPKGQEELKRKYNPYGISIYSSRAEFLKKAPDFRMMHHVGDMGLVAPYPNWNGGYKKEFKNYKVYFPILDGGSLVWPSDIFSYAYGNTDNKPGLFEDSDYISGFLDDGTPVKISRSDSVLLTQRLSGFTSSGVPFEVGEKGPEVISNGAVIPVGDNPEAKIAQDRINRVGTDLLESEYKHFAGDQTVDPANAGDAAAAALNLQQPQASGVKPETDAKPAVIPHPLTAKAKKSGDKVKDVKATVNTSKMPLKDRVQYAIDTATLETEQSIDYNVSQVKGLTDTLVGEVKKNNKETKGFFDTTKEFLTGNLNISELLENGFNAAKNTILSLTDSLLEFDDEFIKSQVDASSGEVAALKAKPQSEEAKAFLESTELGSFEEYEKLDNKGKYKALKKSGQFGDRIRKALDARLEQYTIDPGMSDEQVNVQAAYDVIKAYKEKNKGEIPQEVQAQILAEYNAKAEKKLSNFSDLDNVYIARYLDEQGFSTRSNELKDLRKKNEGYLPHPTDSESYKKSQANYTEGFDLAKKAEEARKAEEEKKRKEEEEKKRKDEELKKKAEEEKKRKDEEEKKKKEEAELKKKAEEEKKRKEEGAELKKKAEDEKKKKEEEEEWDKEDARRRAEANSYFAEIAAKQKAKEEAKEVKQVKNISFEFSADTGPDFKRFGLPDSDVHKMSQDEMQKFVMTKVTETEEYKNYLDYASSFGTMRGLGARNIYHAIAGGYGGNLTQKDFDLYNVHTTLEYINSILPDTLTPQQKWHILNSCAGSWRHIFNFDGANHDIVTKAEEKFESAEKYIIGKNKNIKPLHWKNIEEQKKKSQDSKLSLQKSDTIKVQKPISEKPVQPVSQTVPKTASKESPKPVQPVSKSVPQTKANDNKPVQPVSQTVPTNLPKTSAPIEAKSIPTYESKLPESIRKAIDNGATDDELRKLMYQEAKRTADFPNDADDVNERYKEIDRYVKLYRAQKSGELKVTPTENGFKSTGVISGVPQVKNSTPTSNFALFNNPKARRLARQAETLKGKASQVKAISGQPNNTATLVGNKPVEVNGSPVKPASQSVPQKVEVPKPAVKTAESSVPKKQEVVSDKATKQLEELRRQFGFAENERQQKEIEAKKAAIYASLEEQYKDPKYSDKSQETQLKRLKELGFEMPKIQSDHDKISFSEVDPTAGDDFSADSLRKKHAEFLYDLIRQGADAETIRKYTSPEYIGNWLKTKAGSGYEYTLANFKFKAIRNGKGISSEAFLHQYPSANMALSKAYSLMGSDVHQELIRDQMDKQRKMYELAKSDPQNPEYVAWLSKAQEEEKKEEEEKKLKEERFKEYVKSQGLSLEDLEKQAEEERIAKNRALKEKYKNVKGFVLADDDFADGGYEGFSDKPILEKNSDGSRTLSSEAGMEAKIKLDKMNDGGAAFIPMNAQHTTMMEGLQKYIAQGIANDGVVPGDKSYKTGTTYSTDSDSESMKRKLANDLLAGVRDKFAGGGIKNYDGTTYADAFSSTGNAFGNLFTGNFEALPGSIQKAYIDSRNSGLIQNFKNAGQIANYGFKGMRSGAQGLAARGFGDVGLLGKAAKGAGTIAVGMNVISGVNNFANGEYFNGSADLAQAGVSTASIVGSVSGPVALALSLGIEDLRMIHTIGNVSKDTVLKKYAEDAEMALMDTEFLLNCENYTHGFISEIKHNHSLSKESMVMLVKLYRSWLSKKGYKNVYERAYEAEGNEDFRRKFAQPLATLNSRKYSAQKIGLTAALYSIYKNNPKIRKTSLRGNLDQIPVNNTYFNAKDYEYNGGLLEDSSVIKDTFSQIGQSFKEGWGFADGGVQGLPDPNKPFAFTAEHNINTTENSLTRNGKLVSHLRSSDSQLKFDIGKKTAPTQSLSSQISRVNQPDYTKINPIQGPKLTQKQLRESEKYSFSGADSAIRIFGTNPAYIIQELQKIDPNQLVTLNALPLSNLVPESDYRGLQHYTLTAKEALAALTPDSVKLTSRELKDLRRRISNQVSYKDYGDSNNYKIRSNSGGSRATSIPINIFDLPDWLRIGLGEEGYAESAPTDLLNKLIGDKARSLIPEETTMGKIAGFFGIGKKSWDEKTYEAYKKILDESPSLAYNLRHRYAANDNGTIYHGHLGALAETAFLELFKRNGFDIKNSKSIVLDGNTLSTNRNDLSESSNALETKEINPNYRNRKPEDIFTIDKNGIIRIKHPTIESLIKSKPNYNFAEGGTQKIVPLASGGVVKQPIIGEKGREAVIPFNDSAEGKQTMMELGGVISDNITHQFGIGGFFKNMLKRAGKYVLNRVTDRGMDYLASKSPEVFDKIIPLATQILGKLDPFIDKSIVFMDNVNGIAENINGIVSDGKNITSKISNFTVEDAVKIIEQNPEIVQDILNLMQTSKGTMMKLAGETYFLDTQAGKIGSEQIIDGLKENAMNIANSNSAMVYKIAKGGNSSNTVNNIVYNNPDDMYRVAEGSPRNIRA